MTEKRWVWLLAWMMLVSLGEAFLPCKASFSWLKWTINRRRVGQDCQPCRHSGVQVSLFQIGVNGVLTDLPTGATAHNPGGSKRTGQKAGKMLEDSGKWFDDNFNSQKGRPLGKSVVHFRLEGEEFIFDGYAWKTANDEPVRDPHEWSLEGSNDRGVTWTLLDQRDIADEESVIPQSRLTLTPLFHLQMLPSCTPVTPNRTMSPMATSTRIEFTTPNASRSVEFTRNAPGASSKSTNGTYSITPLATTSPRITSTEAVSASTLSAAYSSRITVNVSESGRPSATPTNTFTTTATVPPTTSLTGGPFENVSETSSVSAPASSSTTPRRNSSSSTRSSTPTVSATRHFVDTGSTPTGSPTKEPLSNSTSVPPSSETGAVVKDGKETVMRVLPVQIAKRSVKGGLMYSQHRRGTRRRRRRKLDMR